MSGLTGQSWFWPALIVIIGLPIALLLLQELYVLLNRRGNAFAKPVALLRNWVLPAAAVYLLLQQLEIRDADPTWSKITATVVGFLIMLLLLAGANAALFGEAKTGSWRDRLPGIFIDLGRLVLIVIGIGLLLSWVWGANIGGLITAVGVTSIVIGLAVQSAVGPVISGLLLLFEQPFRIGDWLDTKRGKGRVVEVNWRAVHIDTENGVRIIPNSDLAGDAFVNLSRTTAPYFKAKATLAFSAEDAPGQVKRALLAVAETLPGRLLDVRPTVTPLGSHEVHERTVGYRVMVPVASPAEADGVVALLLHRAWYAGQRNGLHLDGVGSDSETTRAYVAEKLHAVGLALGLDADAIATMIGGARLLPFAEGETVQTVNSIPKAMGFIIEGRVETFVTSDDGHRLPLGELGEGDYLGGTSLTRQRMITGVVAVTDTTIVAVSREAMNTVVQKDHRLARQIGEAIEMRRRAAREALAQAAQLL